MNYSSTSISSVEVPDKSQALKWISRLTCLHSGAVAPPPRSIRAPPPLPFFFSLAISAWQKLSEGPEAWQMWQCNTHTPTPWWIAPPHQSTKPSMLSLDSCWEGRDSCLERAVPPNVGITHSYNLYVGHWSVKQYKIVRSIKLRSQNATLWLLLYTHNSSSANKN